MFETIRIIEAEVAERIRQAAQDRIDITRTQDEIEMFGAHLHSEQKRISFGDYYITSTAALGYGDASEPKFVLGRVPTVGEWDGLIKIQGDDYQLMWELVSDQLRSHILPGFTHTEQNPEPWFNLFKPYAFSCWPITAEVFNAARIAGWNVINMDNGNYAHLHIAVSALLAHVESVKL